MDNEMNEIFRRASLASQTTNKGKSLEEEKVREANKGPEPKDVFYIVRIMLVLIGLLQGLPGIFCVTANNYWMYKFRNITMDTVDSHHRTPLQAFFVSWISIVGSIPSVVSAILSVFYGHKVRTRPRLLGTLTIVLSCFILLAALTNINTDTWQLGFFCLTLGVVVTINASMSLFHASSMMLISKFPPRYTQFYLYGEGSTGIFSAVMQIISLALSPSSTGAALIYFLTGMFTIALTLFLIYVTKFNYFVNYYTSNDEQDTKRPVYKISEIFASLREIWPCVTIMFVIGILMTVTHPNITTLVVSENYGNGDPWSDKYFVPVITFLFSNITSLLGRFASLSLKIKNSTAWIWVIVIIVRSVVLIGLVILCNAWPRSHLPVVFNHDWQYIIIMGTMGFTGGGLFNIMFMSMQELAKGNEERAYLSMMVFGSVIMAAISPLGLLAVKIL